MRPVVTVKVVEDLLKSGGDLSGIPANAIITPAAQDLLAGQRPAIGNGGGARTSREQPANMAGDTHETVAAPGPPWSDPSGDPVQFFNSPENRTRREQIVDIGRRLWTREYVDGNGGNISVRVGKTLALCTPTQISKGFMRPEDMCLVDLNGKQVAGTRKRTSEILMHLEIMKAQPDAVACVHGHPPYTTAFAASGVKPPNNILPEFELFIGDVPIAGYETPGTMDIARKVADLSVDHNTILMANHGVVTWSHLSVEDAYFKVEILEAYCRTLMVASQLGKMPNRFTTGQVQDLLNIKQSLGVPDPRIGKDISEIALEDDAQWRPGVMCVAPQLQDCSCAAGEASDQGYDEEAEEIVQRVTDLIMERLG